MAETPYPQTDRELRRHVERSAGGRAGYKQLIRELGLGGGRERRLLLEQLARMTARGELVKIEPEMWALPAAVPAKTARVARGENLQGERRAGGRGGAASAGDGLWANRDRLVAGRLDLHRDGYGFVRPNGSSDRADDLFIPPNELNGAMQGDEVLVDEAPPGRDGRRSGRVARVLTRRNPTVVGIFHYVRTGRRGLGSGRTAFEEAGFDPRIFGGNYVTPLDERIAQPILIPEGAEVVATAGETPHRVLGEEAQVWRRARATKRGRQVETGAFAQGAPEAAAGVTADVGSSAALSTQVRSGRDDRESEAADGQVGYGGYESLEGMAVDVEITDFSQPGRPARGRVIEVLGPPDAFGVDVEIIIRKHHLPHVFPTDVLAEAAISAEQTVETLGAEEIGLRRDFRGLPIVTIDGETARDFDDAVMVRELANGNWELQVHIADVSHYVRPGTALDLEARFRGTSVYFPDRAIPMLPPQLSSGMCSLRPDEDRLVLSCVMEIDGRGEVVGYEVGEGIIRSAQRMTYTQVQAILDGDAIVRGEFGDLAGEFERMYELALKLNAKRKRRGSIDFDLPEPVVRFDPEGNMASIVRSERGWSHRLIEEFMLSANECVATWIERQVVASIYRIHEVPDPKRIVDFEETAAGFGYSLGIGNLPVKKLTMKSDRRDVRSGFRGAGRDGGAKVHEVPERIPVTPQMYQKLTAKIAGTPEERILAYLMLRSLKQARYSEKNEGHFALASPSYTHFTSPIRRYPDLIVHRLLRALLESGASPVGEAILSTDAQPWAAEPKTGRNRQQLRTPIQSTDPINREELAAIATESSQTERRADDAERELIEWKKIKFMQDRVGEEFDGIVLSCTKYGFFVELEELFIEGLVPLASLDGFGAKDYRDEDRYLFRDTDRVIVGTRSGRVFKMGKLVRVLLDRIDRQQRRLQFALVAVRGETTEEVAPGAGSLRKKKGRAVAGDEARRSPERSGKPKKGKAPKRLRERKAKGKRK
jgi:ribonuclease R